MAASPRFKVYDHRGVYMGACKEIEGAACLVSLYGPMSTIRDGHTMIVWTEERDGIASDSYDHTVEVVSKRIYL